MQQTVYVGSHVMLQEGGGGVVGLRRSLLNNEWVDMCGEVYTPAVVTNEPKIYEVAASGEVPPTGGRGI